MQPSKAVPLCTTVRHKHPDYLLLGQASWTILEGYQPWRSVVVITIIIIPSGASAIALYCCLIFLKKASSSTVSLSIILFSSSLSASPSMSKKNQINDINIGADATLVLKTKLPYPLQPLPCIHFISVIAAVSTCMF